MVLQKVVSNIHITHKKHDYLIIYLSLVNFVLISLEPSLFTNCAIVYLLSSVPSLLRGFFKSVVLLVVAVATLDFLAIGGDHQAYFYEKIPSSRKRFFPNILERDAIVQRLKENGTSRPEDFFSEQKKNIELVSPN